MTKKFWSNQRVMITGGHGFLGRHLSRLLKKLNPQKLFLPTHAEYDLRTQAACAEVVKDCDLVIHLAANVGGIGYNQKNPGTLFS